MEVGSWIDKGAIGISSHSATANKSATAYNAIDPNLISVDDTYYLSFGSFWQDIYQVEMDSNALTIGDDDSYNIAYVFHKSYDHEEGTNEKNLGITRQAIMPKRDLISSNTKDTTICSSAVALVVAMILRCRILEMSIGLSCVAPKHLLETS